MLTLSLRNVESAPALDPSDSAVRRLHPDPWEIGRQSTLDAELASSSSPAPATAPQKGSPTAAGAERVAPFGALPASFGRYLVRRRLGKGGMGAVYLAWDTQLERDVALKIPTSGRDEAAAARFLREARAAAALDRAHICPIYDYGQVDGVPYLTLKFVDGGTLADALDAGPLPVRQAVELCRRVAEALDAAHRAGVTHRDLKPSNILLDAAGQPWVTDFGLARREAVDPAVIKEGEIFGTPVYMSPEQAGGQGDRVGAASDIYSLGVVLYEMLAGGTPFRGNLAEVLEQIQHAEPEPPSQARPALDARLDAICQKALAKQPGDRYPTAGDFAAALGRYLQTLPAPMPGLAANADETATRRRTRLVRWTLAIAVLLLLAVLGFFSLGGNRVVTEIARRWQAEAPVALAPAAATDAEGPQADITPPAEPAPPEVLVEVDAPQLAFASNAPRESPGMAHEPLSRSMLQRSERSVRMHFDERAAATPELALVAVREEAGAAATLMGGTGRLSLEAKQRAADLAACIACPQPRLSSVSLNGAEVPQARASAAEGQCAVEIWRRKPAAHVEAAPAPGDFEPVGLHLEDVLCADLQPEDQFAVRLVNHGAHLAAAALTIDGLNPLTAAAADPAQPQTAWVLVPPGPLGVFLSGWRGPQGETAPFQVSAVGERYGLAAEGQVAQAATGVITVRFAAAANVALGEKLPDDEPAAASPGGREGRLIGPGPRQDAVRIGLEREVVSIRYARGQGAP